MKDRVLKEVNFYRETLDRNKKEGATAPTIALSVEAIELMLDYIEKTDKEQEHYYDIRMEAVNLLPTIERFIRQGFSYDAMHRTEDLLNRIIGHK
jgi:hypothetical protein